MKCVHVTANIFQLDTHFVYINETIPFGIFIVVIDADALAPCRRQDIRTHDIDCME